MKDKPMPKRGMLSNLSSVYNPLQLLAPFLLQERFVQALGQQEWGYDNIHTDKVAKDCVEWKLKSPTLKSLPIQASPGMTCNCMTHPYMHTHYI